MALPSDREVLWNSMTVGRDKNEGYAVFGLFPKETMSDCGFTTKWSQILCE